MSNPKRVNECVVMFVMFVFVVRRSMSDHVILTLSSNAYLSMGSELEGSSRCSSSVNKKGRGPGLEM